MADTFELNSAESESLFQSLDTNNDGEINYSEFLAATLQGRVKAHEDVLRKTFMRFDKGETGYITEEAFREILGDSWEEKDIKDLIEEADSNRDGKISYDEFLFFLQHDTKAATP